MSNFTEQAIVRAFVELLNEKPFDKVTVLDIAKRCGINRNTFYYHFHDIYDLLDAVLKAEEERIFNEVPVDESSWRECLLELSRWARENERAIKNVYRSINRDRVEDYIFSTTRVLMDRYIRAQAAGLGADEKVIENMVLLYSATVEGLLLNWLRGGMRDDLEEFIDRLSYVYKDLARMGFERISALVESGEPS